MTCLIRRRQAKQYPAVCQGWAVLVQEGIQGRDQALGVERGLVVFSGDSSQHDRVGVAAGRVGNAQVSVGLIRRYSGLAGQIDPGRVSAGGGVERIVAEADGCGHGRSVQFDTGAKQAVDAVGDGVDFPPIKQQGAIRAQLYLGVAGTQ